MKVFISWSK